MAKRGLDQYARVRFTYGLKESRPFEKFVRSAFVCPKMCVYSNCMDRISVQIFPICATHRRARQYVQRAYAPYNAECVSQTGLQLATMPL